jgi:protein arginine N-methyltransferase 1
MEASANGKKNRNSKNKEEEKYNNGDKKTYVRRQPRVKPSVEEGFAGTPEEWFNDDEFKKQLVEGLSGGEKHDYYYGSYSHFYIHEEMLKDQVRTLAYQRAIESNPMDFKDKVVLDIGAGTGILSIFAARSGAKHVYAIENADIAHFAREIVKQNGLSDKITVIKGKMEEIELPV